MKISIHSDLHLEGGSLPKGFLQNEHDVVILCGDIVNAINIHKLKTIREATDKPILYVPGNHEFYRGNFDRTLKVIENACEEYGIAFLYRGTYDIGNVRFIGITGWSDLQAYSDISPDHKKADVSRGISDFYAIGGWSIDKMFEESSKDYKYAEDKLKESELDNMKTVLISHYPLSEKLNNSKFPVTTISSYFVNNWLDSLPLPDYHVYGHTHGELDDVDLYGTICVNNQMGYSTEWLDKYDVNYVLEINA